MFFQVKAKCCTHCPARAWSQRSCTAPVLYSARHSSSTVPHTDPRPWWWHHRRTTTASTGAERWWRWCLSNRPVPGNNPVTGDLSWPSLLSSVSLYVLSLLVSLAGSFCSGTSGVFEQSLCTRLLLVSLYTIWSLWASPLLQLSSVALVRSPLTLSVFLSKSWAGTMRGCLPSELSCLTACSLWGSVQIEEDFPIASLRQALSLHGFFQFSPSLLLACLTPTTIFPSTPDSSGSMKGSGKKSKKKKKARTQKSP